MPESRRAAAWPLALVATAAMLASAALYVFETARALPREALRGAGRLLEDARRVAAAFRTGTQTTSFVAYATELSGHNRLQFATLRQIEVFERKDEVALFWGRLALPDVVVEARAPVEYSYYLDLDAPWRFVLEGHTVVVVAPEIRFNQPALDVSALAYEVRKGSVLRDEAAVVERLRLGLTELSRIRARDHVALVRETGRRRTEAFVETWLRSRFEDARDFRALVGFADEPPPRPPGGA